MSIHSLLFLLYISVMIQQLHIVLSHTAAEVGNINAFTVIGSVCLCILLTFPAFRQTCCPKHTRTS